MKNSVAIEVSCAVEVFVATALLHREQPGRPEFTIRDIVNRAARENITGELRAGVSIHASQHCVANKAPNPGRHKMLIATGKHTRRLILPSDEEQVHSGRTGKMFPDPGELPEQYLSLLEWAKKRYNDAAKARTNRDPHMGELSHVKSEESPNAGQWLESLFELEGLGKEYWKDIDPDEFVRKLREGWE